MTQARQDPHWVAMSGSYGCLPDYCEAFGSYAEALESLRVLFELEEHAALEAALASEGYAELGRDFGADYAEIIPCHCARPSVHSSGGGEP